MSVKIELHFPAGHLGATGEDDSLTLIIRALSLKHAEPGKWADKYGADYEDDLILLHHYCWCEKETCMWCGAECGCAGLPVESYLDGQRIDDWSAANEQIVAPMPQDVAEHGTREYREATKVFDKSIEERDRRLVMVYPPRVHTCRFKGMLEDRPHYGLDWRPPSSAPNFWHKPSGVKVWWYKYIGRDMEYNRGTLTAEEWQQLRSLVTEEDIRKVISEGEEAQASFAAMIAAVSSVK